ncbi:hypothetical protein HJC23_000149 [Cyclotella cryptica]|uniref:RRM domain-containing protein n=1 Tax=Cyclotella cryptica TaxID=29204 RepID=A0ABD3PJL8_9STRA|eukprot:CCRYP_014093-RA/>CCRYP_014093-RA protein AED:0.19 eAED:0.19 QI:0/0/0/1/1/1/2/0/393
MSLMKSIFGASNEKSARSTKGDASDLFNSPVIPKIAPSTRATAKSKNSGKEGNTADSVTDKTLQEQTNDPGPTPAEHHEKVAEETVPNKVDVLEEEQRTIFVGNLPPDISRKALASIFKECGKVASSRLRSVAVAGVKLPPSQVGNQNLMRKVCANTGKLLEDAPKKSAQGYVVFQSVDSVEKALKLNNTIYQSHTIRVDHAKPTIDSANSVFVGNLPYGAEDETLRSHFLTGLGITGDGEDDNIVKGVRIIRDKETQKCKGFGYVTFSDASYVPMALELNESTYMKRVLRVMVSGKRFKGKRGDNVLERQSFEGQRATEAVGKKKLGAVKRKLDGEVTTSSGGKTKRRRSRSEKVGPAKSGLSKRAEKERKVDRRVKKLEKRATKGMGKKKH